MGKNNFKNRKTSKNNKREPKSLEDKSPKRELLIVFSFRDFDRNQGQGFEEWETEELLALACERLASLSQMTVSQAVHGEIVKIYTKVDFPPISAFTYPAHVPEGVKWASMHVQGKECIIGYFEDNVFYIVFLDMHHEFWITEKKNT